MSKSITSAPELRFPDQSLGAEGGAKKEKLMPRIESARCVHDSYVNDEGETVLTIKHYVKFVGEPERLAHTQIDV